MENFEGRLEQEQNIEAEIGQLRQKGEGLLLEIPEDKMSDEVYDAWYAADQAAEVGKNREEAKNLLLTAIKLLESKIEETEKQKLRKSFRQNL